MRPLRLLPLVVLAVGIQGIASRWELVTSAYLDPVEPAAEVNFGGLDLGVGLTPIGPSPFRSAPAPDTRAVPLALAYEVVEESPAPPIMTGGTALLKGTVSGPDGPLSGVVVRIERHSGQGVATTDVGTDLLGRWKVQGLEGGRYRVRAWVPGVATMDDSAVFFLEAGQLRSLAFALEPVDREPRLRFHHRGDIPVGGVGTVAVTTTTTRVDSDGFVEVAGLAGAIVTLDVRGPVTVDSPTVSADGDGVARFVLTCTAAGTGSAVITHQEQSMEVALPSCTPPPPPPVPDTAVPSGPSDGSDPGGSPDPGSPTSPTSPTGPVTGGAGNG